MALLNASENESQRKLLGNAQKERFFRRLEMEWISKIGYRSFAETELMIIQ